MTHGKCKVTSFFHFVGWNMTKSWSWLASWSSSIKSGLFESWLHMLKCNHWITELLSRFFYNLPNLNKFCILSATGIFLVHYTSARFLKVCYSSQPKHSLLDELCLVFGWRDSWNESSHLFLCNFRLSLLCCSFRRALSTVNWISAVSSLVDLTHGMWTLVGTVSLSSLWVIH